MQRPVRRWGDPIFRTKGVEITEIDDSIRTLAQDLIDTMDANNAIGMAVNQIGVAVRLFALRNSIPLPDGSSILSPEPLVFINPKILSLSKETQRDYEGSPSFPGIQEIVERPMKVTIEALDLNGVTFVDHSEGLNARVRLHENDHLNGIVFVDHLPPKVKKRIEPTLNKIQKESKPL